jgi:tetratricopeptide (TPR) repeat protein
MRLGVFECARDLARCALLALVFVTASVRADEAQDVDKLVKAGQLDQARQRADVFLATKPRDAQMGFLKGVILTRQGRVDDAISVFQRLTEDYPELAEPYNNLAVLFASRGQYEKARAALEMAIRTNPIYATAYENLGDVYAKLASRAYDKSLQLDGNNAAVKDKLALMHNLGGNAEKPGSAKSPSGAAAAK